mmetsp:Transcript_87866/g.158400  ORF Transcript_87866/g.158400 Transcript_87866/m.158400 type:complete len:337 (-) Transcript_87866:1421-2431(-)
MLVDESFERLRVKADQPLQHRHLLLGHNQHFLLGHNLCSHVDRAGGYYYGLLARSLRSQSLTCRGGFFSRRLGGGGLGHFRSLFCFVRLGLIALLLRLHLVCCFARLFGFSLLLLFHLIFCFVRLFGFCLLLFLLLLLRQFALGQAATISLHHGRRFLFKAWCPTGDWDAEAARQSSNLEQLLLLFLTGKAVLNPVCQRVPDAIKELTLLFLPRLFCRIISSFRDTSKQSGVVVFRSLSLALLTRSKLESCSCRGLPVRTRWLLSQLEHGVRGFGLHEGADLFRNHSSRLDVLGLINRSFLNGLGGSLVLLCSNGLFCRRGWLFCRRCCFCCGCCC